MEWYKGKRPSTGEENNKHRGPGVDAGRLRKLRTECIAHVSTASPFSQLLGRTVPNSFFGLNLEKEIVYLPFKCFTAVLRRADDQAGNVSRNGGKARRGEQAPESGTDHVN